MSRSGKIDTFVRELETLIREGASGFTAELPGQREMAQRFGISQSAVHIGMAELERRGLIRIEPYRGAVVIYRPEKTAVVREAAGRINLAICEELTYQREFWMDSVRRFRELHEGVEVKVRFSPRQPAWRTPPTAMRTASSFARNNIATSNARSFR